MINPGSRPVEGATEEQAAHNLQAFVYEATERGLRLAGEPQRQPDADIDGRYAWDLPLEGGGHVRILMPGADLAQLRSLSAQAYCIRVGEGFWWWNDAVGMAVPSQR